MKTEKMDWTAKWICPKQNMGDCVPVFMTEFSVGKEVEKARLLITAMGVYEAHMDGKRVGEFVLAPGWTSYRYRLQYQEYNVTDMVKPGTHQLKVYVGKGWYGSRVFNKFSGKPTEYPAGLLAQLEITYVDGSSEILSTDNTWKVAESEIAFSEIYDGEICDANKEAIVWTDEAEIFEGPWNTLIPQQGEELREQEVLVPAGIFKAPNGEVIIDFGQEISGYVELTVNAKAGQVVDLSFGEVLDKDGNFYNANYRSAKAQYHYVCREGRQTWHPTLTFYGFRYVRINEFPGGPEAADTNNFIAIAVYSNMKRTGYLECSDPMLNRLFDNVLWGQRDNFVDVPTDCPQRDERWGWTGDAQVFVRAACLNYDTERFYTKWLADMAADQEENGGIPWVIPNLFHNHQCSSAWGDAAVICSWMVYLAYGSSQILQNQFECMKGWVDYITNHTEKEYLWIGGEHFGDWLGLDAPSGSYKGSSREELIASAYYAYSTELLVKAGKVLGIDVQEYEKLYQNIVDAFRNEYPVYYTQTECAVAVHFCLAQDAQKTADQLADMVKAVGNKLQTGFVGTPYLLHALSAHGHAELAYTLLLRREYPGWLSSVKKGATTIWEHWDGIMENGDFWSTDMNSFNHYAYGAVADWVYSVAAGIQTVEEYPGYEKVRIAPIPDARLDWLKATLDTRKGRISSRWKKQDNFWRYEITTPVDAEIVIDGQTHEVKPGCHYFYSKL